MAKMATKKALYPMNRVTMAKRLCREDPRLFEKANIMTPECTCEGDLEVHIPPSFVDASRSSGYGIPLESTVLNPIEVEIP